MKRRLIIAAVIVLCAISCLWAQASGESMAKDTRELVAFTDDLGRTVMVPEDIDSVTPTGSTAQVILLTFDPTLIAGLTTGMDEAEYAYHPGLSKDIPVLGTFYGKKANLNKEALIVADPDVVVDIGEIKGSVGEMIADLDALQEQIGIPVVFIENYLAHSEDTYLRLGELLGDEERARSLAKYAGDAVDFASLMDQMHGGRITFYYSSAVDGLEAIPEGNFHGEVLEAVGGVNVCPSRRRLQDGDGPLERLGQSRSRQDRQSLSRAGAHRELDRQSAIDKPSGRNILGRMDVLWRRGRHRCLRKGQGILRAVLRLHDSAGGSGKVLNLTSDGAWKRAPCPCSDKLHHSAAVQTAPLGGKAHQV